MSPYDTQQQDIPVLPIDQSEPKTVIHLPKYPSRRIVMMTLTKELGKSESTDHLIDWIEEAWETIDFLQQRFGRDTVYKIIHAPSPLASRN